jgi:hypothetical protein
VHNVKAIPVSQPRAVLAVCLLSLLLGSPALPESQEAKAARHTEQAIAALTHLTDADSLAAAGLLSLGKHRDQSSALVARATAAAPERADLVWLQLGVCQKLGSCDPEPIEIRLREVDPSNAAGWMGALARARSSNNQEATDAALTAIGHTDRLDIYWTMLISRLSRAVVQTDKQSPAETVVTVIGYLAAQPIPGYEAASKACKGDPLLRAEITAACRGVARVFQQGDTYLTEMIGVAIAKRVWPEDSLEWKAAAEARRVYDYRSKLWLKLDMSDNASTDKYLRLCSTNRREQDVLLAQIIAAGENPNPSAE